MWEVDFWVGKVWGRCRSPNYKAWKTRRWLKHMWMTGSRSWPNSQQKSSAQLSGRDLASMRLSAPKTEENDEEEMFAEHKAILSSTDDQEMKTKIPVKCHFYTHDRLRTESYASLKEPFWSTLMGLQVGKCIGNDVEFSWVFDHLPVLSPRASGRYLLLTTETLPVCLCIGH